MTHNVQNVEFQVLLGLRRDRRSTAAGRVRVLRYDEGLPQGRLSQGHGLIYHGWIMYYHFNPNM